MNGSFRNSQGNGEDVYTINDPAFKPVTQELGELFKQSSTLLEESLLDSIAEVNIESYNNFVNNLRENFVSLKRIIEDKINQGSFRTSVFSQQQPIQKIQTVHEATNTSPPKRSNSVESQKDEQLDSTRKSKRSSITSSPSRKQKQDNLESSQAIPAAKPEPFFKSSQINLEPRSTEYEEDENNNIWEIKKSFVQALNNLNACEPIIEEFLQSHPQTGESLSETYQTFRHMVNEILHNYQDTLAQVNDAVIRLNYYHERQLEKCREENNRLSQEIQLKEGNLIVYCRIKPEYHDDVVLHSFDNYSINVRNQKYQISDDYHFDYCFGPDSTQEEVHNRCTFISNAVISGYNYAIYGFGHPSSGKTYTLMGPEDDIGLTYRLINDILERTEAQRTEYVVKLSMCELYSDELYDLLGGDKAKITIQSDSNGETILKDLPEYEIKDSYRLAELLAEGNRNRAVIPTTENQFSTKAHCFVMCTVSKVNEKGTTYSTGKLVIGDLGSFDKSPVPVATLESTTSANTAANESGKLIRETSIINKSISSLLKVITALKNKSAHVPFRDSKLTQLLKNSLVGNYGVVFLCTVTADMTSINDSCQTLQFAEGLYEINHPAPKKNIVSDKATIESLRRELEACYVLLHQRQNIYTGVTINNNNNNNGGYFSPNSTTRSTSTTKLEQTATSTRSTSTSKSPRSPYHNQQQQQQQDTSELDEQILNLTDRVNELEGQLEMKTNECIKADKKVKSLEQEAKKKDNTIEELKQKIERSQQTIEDLKEGVKTEVVSCQTTYEDLEQCMGTLTNIQRLEILEGPSGPIRKELAEKTRALELVAGEKDKYQSMLSGAENSSDSVERQKMLMRYTIELSNMIDQVDNTKSELTKEVETLQGRAPLSSTINSTGGGASGGGIDDLSASRKMSSSMRMSATATMRAKTPLKSTLKMRRSMNNNNNDDFNSDNSDDDNMNYHNNSNFDNDEEAAEDLGATMLDSDEESETAGIKVPKRPGQISYSSSENNSNNTRGLRQSPMTASLRRANRKDRSDDSESPRPNYDDENGEGGFDLTENFDTPIPDENAQLADSSSESEQEYAPTQGDRLGGGNTYSTTVTTTGEDGTLRAENSTTNWNNKSKKSTQVTSYDNEPNVEYSVEDGSRQPIQNNEEEEEEEGEAEEGEEYEEVEVEEGEEGEGEEADEEEGEEEEVEVEEGEEEEEEVEVEEEEEEGEEEEEYEEVEVEDDESDI